MNLMTRQVCPSEPAIQNYLTPTATPEKSFEDFNISPEVLMALTAMGFKEPTPIQTGTLKLALRGADVIGQAQTGTGKTAAFGIPIIEKANPAERRVQALVMAPTRELAIQVSEELNRIGKGKGIISLPVYGGQSISLQLDRLKRGVHVVVGTPGRLLDHVNRKTLILHHVQTVVLDEADVMLDMGFIDDIKRLLKETPEERQTLLFSATLSEPILKIGKQYMRNPAEIRISKKNVAVESVKQVYYETSNTHRFETLCRILDVTDLRLTLIFCETKQSVDQLASQLIKAGYPSEAIHGDLSQVQRDKVMNKFREGTIKILVATDVAARGINISAVSHVINYHLPKNTDTYIHRIGRTGRAGQEGEAITLIALHELRNLKSIENQLKIKIEKKTVPSDEEVKDTRLKMIHREIEQVLKQGAVKKYSSWLNRLYSGFTPEEVASALLYLHDFVEIPVEQTFIKGKDKNQKKTRFDFGHRNVRPEKLDRSMKRGNSFSGGFKRENKDFRGREIEMVPVMTRTKRTKNSDGLKWEID